MQTPTPRLRVTTIGSALIDVFVQSPSFRIDELGNLRCGAVSGKLEVEHMTVQTGGGASNTAVGFARLGLTATCVAELGRDEFAQLVVDDLVKEDVVIKHLVREKKEQTGGSVILVPTSGQRLVLVHRGAASQLEPRDIPDRVITESDWVHVSSVSGQLETLEKIFSLARSWHRRISWNPGQGEIELLLSGKLGEQGVLPQAEILFLNHEEWHQLSPVQNLLASSITQIVITDSHRGGQILVAGRADFSYQAQKVSTLDTTGAGDAFAVAYVTAQLAGHDIATAAKWGAENAAAVVQRLGAKPGLLRHIT